MIVQKAAMPVSDGKIPKVAKSARKRTLFARLVIFRHFVVDYFIDATLSAMVTTIMIALVIGHVSQNWIVRRSRRGAAPPIRLALGAVMRGS